MNATIILLAHAMSSAFGVPGPPPPAIANPYAYTVRWGDLNDAQRQAFPAMYAAWRRGEVTDAARVWVFSGMVGGGQ